MRMKISHLEWESVKLSSIKREPYLSRHLNIPKRRNVTHGDVAASAAVYCSEIRYV